MMSGLIESLKRLYANNKIAIAKLDQLKTNGKITAEELSYITTAPVNELDEYKSYYQETQSILPQEVVK